MAVVPYLSILNRLKPSPYLILALSVEQNPSPLLLWLFQSIKFPVVADLTFIVGLNAQTLFTLYVIFGQKRTKLLGFLMGYDSYTTLGQLLSC